MPAIPDIRNAIRSECVTSDEVKKYKNTVENQINCTYNNKELGMVKKQKEDLEQMHTTCLETLTKRENELMKIITIQNQNIKILGEQLSNLSAASVIAFSQLSNLSVASEIAFSQINQTKSQDDKCHAFGKFNFRISSLQFCFIN